LLVIFFLGLKLFLFRLDWLMFHHKPAGLPFSATPSFISEMPLLKAWPTLHCNLPLPTLYCNTPLPTWVGNNMHWLDILFDVIFGLVVTLWIHNWCNTSCLFLNFDNFVLPLSSLLLILTSTGPSFG
jgi:hypothetical protein